MNKDNVDHSKAGDICPKALGHAEQQNHCDAIKTVIEICIGYSNGQNDAESRQQKVLRVDEDQASETCGKSQKDIDAKQIVLPAYYIINIKETL